VLAALVRSHRRKVPGKAFDAIPDRLLAGTRRIAALLRLAVLLHRSHEANELPELRATAKRDQLSLTLPARWLDQRPLLRADLDGEPADMAGLGIALEIWAD
jgi:exopolyphosphatase/guanosine-5'-triphosphate,3'-diphosphate pyrophosphatase